jgi:hypothetical protein
VEFCYVQRPTHPRILIEALLRTLGITNFVASELGEIWDTVTNESLIQEEIKRALNSGNACYHSVQKLLSSRLLSKKHKR